ncbi:unnamed protein product, partial [Staurois parvus]
HCRVAQVGGTGGCTAGHRWVICWAQVGGASGRTAGHRWAELAGWHCWAPIIRALIITCHWTPLITW